LEASPFEILIAEQFNLTMRFYNIATAGLILLVGPAAAGLLGYGICQTGCSEVVVVCYAAAGYTFGTVPGATAPPIIVACNKAYGRC
jgi:hypothetical protein